MEPRRRSAASLNDLARHVELSKGSVSRILNGKGAAFSEATRRRVVAAAEEIGYRPSAVAKALARASTGIVSLCLSGQITPFLAQVSHEFSEAIGARGWGAMVQVYERQRLGTHPEALLGVADGVLLHDTDDTLWPMDAILAALRPRRGAGLPPIVTTGAFGTHPELDHVRVDLAAGAIAGVEHLAADRRRILYVSTNVGGRADGRRTGYRSVVDAAGIAPEMLECHTPGRRAIRSQIKDYCERHGCPEGIFCHNDDVAVAAFWALSDLGRRVPDDVALVGCDGIEDLDYLPCPIPTIVQPLHEVAQTAVAFLDRRLQDPLLPVQRATLSASLRLPEERR